MHFIKNGIGALWTGMWWTRRSRERGLVPSDRLGDDGFGEESSGSISCGPFRLRDRSSMLVINSGIFNFMFILKLKVTSHRDILRRFEGNLEPKSRVVTPKASLHSANNPLGDRGEKEQPLEMEPVICRPKGSHRYRAGRGN